jgi:MoaA/NifB/PqqE/SkfB family radical SAM enzyme
MLKDSFCSSPWFHVRIDPAGRYLPCRWSSHQDTTGYTVENTSISEFINSDIMQGIRATMLAGDALRMCNSCLYQDRHNKVSGRQRQLLKSAITINNFDKSFCSSPHWDKFEYSYQHNGATNTTPVDLQIDLGNTCNSSCIMCSPTYSSKLAQEYNSLIQLDSTLFKSYAPFKNWTNNSALVDKFVAELTKLPSIKYIHFLGGETLYLKSFYDICNRLIDLGLSKNISIGTTTNCTIYTEELEHIICNFKHVHLGLSVESLNKVNDYIRYPSAIDQVKLNISKFLELRSKTNLHLSLRITPTILSIYHLDTLFELMITKEIIAESCNILAEPSCLRIELLPKELVKDSLDKINQVIEKYQLVQIDQTIINQRRDDLVDPVITQIIFEYQNFLKTFTVPNDVEEERYKLVKYLRAFEQVHKNKILDYLPEYEEFLRSYGY